jgi:hypothetical protein
VSLDHRTCFALLGRDMKVEVAFGQLDAPRVTRLIRGHTWLGLVWRASRRNASEGNVAGRLPLEVRWKGRGL